MGLTREAIVSLVEAEIAEIYDPIILDGLRSILVEPSVREMDWDYGPEGQTYPCWVVARDEVANTELVYSEVGFGPTTPWGLVGISYSSMGMDSGWFTNLEDAYCESLMAAELRIWDVLKEAAGGDPLTLASSLSLYEADDVLKEYRKAASQSEKLRYRIERRKAQE